MKSPCHIIISRTDSIGDVILTLPVTGYLKEKFPECKISFIGRSYTQSVVKLSEHIDAFINWDEHEKLKPGLQSDALHQLKADWIIHIFPNKQIAKAAKRAKITNRVGTSHRMYHLTTCNKRVDFTRKKSNLHESQLNFKLLEPIGISEIPPLDKLAEFYGFPEKLETSSEIGSLIDKKRFNLILHPKSKGSAREWGLENFGTLIKILPAEKFKIFISGTTSEAELMKDWLPLYRKQVTDLTGKFSLSEFIQFISLADGLVAASTGPLHIASALGKKAVGIYPPIRPMHPGRWAPIGKNSEVLVKQKECSDCREDMNCHCMKEITAEMVVKTLEN